MSVMSSAPRCLDVGELLILGLVFVVRDHLLYALLIPAGGKLLLAHFGFLRCGQSGSLLEIGGIADTFTS